jgi:signal-transduction protein with cAMP-binding, CBS, and nucleotidyltransferase domain
MTTVKDILSDRDMFSVEHTESVAKVVRAMSDLHVGAILVLGTGELRGIFSERDLMTRVVAADRDAQSTKVADVMTTDLATIEEGATVEEAMELMQNRGCRHLPVLRGGRVVGLVSMRDLMSVELKKKTEEIEHMRAYIHGAQ